MRKLIIFLALAVVHYFATAAMVGWSLSYGLDHFLDGIPYPRFYYRAVKLLLAILMFPLLTIFLKDTKGFWGGIVILLNSALWSVFSMTIYRLICRKGSGWGGAQPRALQPTTLRVAAEL